MDHLLWLKYMYQVIYTIHVHVIGHVRFCLHIFYIWADNMTMFELISCFYAWLWPHWLIQYRHVHMLKEMQHSTVILKRSEIEIQTNFSATIHWNFSREAWNRILFTQLEVWQLSTTTCTVCVFQCSLQCTLEIYQVEYYSRGSTRNQKYFSAE